MLLAKRRVAMNDPKKIMQGLVLQLTGVALAAGAALLWPPKNSHCVGVVCVEEFHRLEVALPIALVGSLLMYIGHRVDRRY